MFNFILICAAIMLIAWLVFRCRRGKMPKGTFFTTASAIIIAVLFILINEHNFSNSVSQKAEEDSQYAASNPPLSSPEAERKTAKHVPDKEIVFNLPGKIPDGIGWYPPNVRAYGCHITKKISKGKETADKNETAKLILVQKQDKYIIRQFGGWSSFQVFEDLQRSASDLPDYKLKFYNPQTKVGLYADDSFTHIREYNDASGSVLLMSCEQTDR